MKNLFNNYRKPIIIALFLLATIIAIFDINLAVGLILLFFLFLITLFVLLRTKINNNILIWLLIIALIIHLGVVLFIYFFHFQPLGTGGGDFTSYHKIAVEMSYRFKQGNFSLEGLKITHYYPVIIGIIYIITLPAMIIGQLFGVWLSVLAILFLYLIVIELGFSKKWAFIIGLIVCFYPSYLFYGSLLLKDGLVILIFLIAMLLVLKIIKNFTLKKFVLFYILLGFLFHFRFYIAYAMLFTFVISWFLLVRAEFFRKKIIYGLTMTIVLGFLPEILLNQGFYGIDCFESYFNYSMFNFYQEEAYKPKETDFSKESTEVSKIPISLSGFDSTWEKEGVSFKKNPLKFSTNYLKYFSYVFLGPFPWQMKYSRHLLALPELLSWYVLLYFIIIGIGMGIKTGKKNILPLIIFSVLVLGAITLFINNFGIITRVRMPAYIILLPLIPLAFNGQSKKYEKNNININL